MLASAFSRRLYRTFTNINQHADHGPDKNSNDDYVRYDLAKWLGEMPWEDYCCYVFRGSAARLSSVPLCICLRFNFRASVFS